jgi:hypothetical protein
MKHIETLIWTNENITSKLLITALILFILFLFPINKSPSKKLFLVVPNGYSSE